MRLRRCGNDAVLVEVDSLGEVEAVRAAVAAAELPDVVELVPAARTVLIVAGPGGLPAVREVLATADLVHHPEADGDEVVIPVRYDGPDLDLVADTAGLTTAEVVELHTGATYRVAFCGFAPGFAYLTGLPEPLRQPRLDSPRTKVPAGSVAVAGEFTAAYPRATPGGWRLIGRTDATLFDPRRPTPALLAPGHRVRFEAVRNTRVLPPERASPTFGTRESYVQDPRVQHSRTLTVLRTGPQTLVQDLGRPGNAHLGVPPSGALDTPSSTLANRLVGNPEDAACLEVLLGGLSLRANASCTVAVTGPATPTRVNGVLRDSPLHLTPGDTLTLGTPQGGLRSYVAVSGGITVPADLGSRSTDLLSGLGPAPLQPDDELPLGDPTGVPVGVDVLVPVQVPDELLVPVLPGPRDDWFDDPARRLREGRWTVSERSNRVGIRLTGTPLDRAECRVGRELPSEGLVTGAVQVPADGHPVVFLADHPTTGGYPVIGVVPRHVLPLLGQARPGTRLRFAPQD